MNLVIDIGNSRCKVAIFDQVLLHTAHYIQFQPTDLALLLKQFAVKKCIYAATGILDQGLVHYIQQYIPFSIAYSSSLTLPIVNAYGSPTTLGHDRIAAAVGAHVFFKKQKLLIIDFGTAITYDFVTNDTYVGGNISMGLQMRYNALHHFTSKLPLLTKSESCEDIGSTTIDAITCGVQLGVAAEINYYVSKYSDHKIIFTGGDRFYFAKKIKSPIFVISKLVEVGLNEILEHNPHLLVKY